MTSSYNILYVTCTTKVHIHTRYVLHLTCTKVHVPSTVQLFAVNCTTYYMCTYYTYRSTFWVSLIKRFLLVKEKKKLFFCIFNKTCSGYTL